MAPLRKRVCSAPGRPAGRRWCGSARSARATAGRPWPAAPWCVGGDEVVECLDAATGKGRWKFAYPSAYGDQFGKGDGPRATPLIADGKVWTLGAAGVLSCVGQADGKKVWQRDLMADYGPRPGFFGVGTSPLREDGRLLVNVGARGAGVVAFDPATGKEVWKATDQGASYASPVAATIDGVRHALFFTREGVLSLDPDTGAVRFSKRWRSRLDAVTKSRSPATSSL